MGLGTTTSIGRLDQSKVKLCDNLDNKSSQITSGNQSSKDGGSKKSVSRRYDMVIGAAARAINELERDIKAALPDIGWCFVEIDVVD